MSPSPSIQPSKALSPLPRSHVAAVEGLEAIRVVRDMLGATNGIKAAPGTIRGDFSSSRQMNLVHASDSEESAARELKLYFAPEQLCSYVPTLIGSFKSDDES